MSLNTSSLSLSVGYSLPLISFLLSLSSSLSFSVFISDAVLDFNLLLGTLFFFRMLHVITGLFGHTSFCLDIQH